MNSAEIKALRNTPIRPAQNIGGHFLTTTKYPLLYQRITKCGCTYLRNLMWYLEHNEVPKHVLGRENSGKKELTADHLTDQQVMTAKHKFVVVRHPVQRFMSLYFDKIIGDPKGSITGTMVKQGQIDLDAGQDLARHRENCHKALDFIAQEQATLPYSKINWHWKPQLVRMSQLRPFEFTTLHLEGLNWQLPQFIGDLIPDFDAAIQAVSQRNASVKPVAAQDVLTKDIRLKIRSIYKTDYKMWKEVRNFWADKQE